MSYAGIAPAFIDLATYGELDKYMYSNPQVDNITTFGFNKVIRSTLKQSISILPLIILFLIYVYLK